MATGPYGAKSMGESGIIPSVAAVANAIFNAIGRRMKDLPITRDKISGSTGMKAFSNANARDVKHAVTLLQQAHQQGHTASVAGGGSDLLQMVKERIVAPDVLVNLKSIKGLDHITAQERRVHDRRPDHAGGDRARRRASGRSTPVLAEAAESVATPQIRNVGDAGRQRLPAAVVLVFPQRFPVPEEWRHAPAFR